MNQNKKREYQAYLFNQISSSIKKNIFKDSFVFKFQKLSHNFRIHHNSRIKKKKSRASAVSSLQGESLHVHPCFSKLTNLQQNPLIPYQMKKSPGQVVYEISSGFQFFIKISLMIRLCIKGRASAVSSLQGIVFLIQVHCKFQCSLSPIYNFLYFSYGKKYY